MEFRLELCIRRMIASLLRVLTSVWCMLIQLQLIQGGLLSGVLDTVGSDVGDLINGIKCDSKTTQMCRMNTVNKSIAEIAMCSIQLTNEFVSSISLFGIVF